MVEESMAFFSAEDPKLFIFLGTQLVQLREMGYARLNSIIEVDEADEAESHQNPPAVGIQLGD